MGHGDGTSANDSVDGLHMDPEDANELLTAAAAAVAAAAIALPNFQDHYNPSSFPPSFQAKEEVNSGQPSVLDMAAFQAAVQSVAALRQQPSTSSGSSPIAESAGSALSPSQRRLLPATVSSMTRQGEPYRGPSYTPYTPLGLPLSSHQPATNSFQASNALASTSFAVPSTVISNSPSFGFCPHSQHLNMMPYYRLFLELRENRETQPQQRCWAFGFDQSTEISIAVVCRLRG